ncbi:MAG TPA: hypothetical protein PLO23_00095 [Alphaproteobacteria bacterium]|nr:hypothetical protein [Alphaproteobacteria bacterium]
MKYELIIATALSLVMASPAQAQNKTIGNTPAASGTTNQDTSVNRDRTGSGNIQGGVTTQGSGNIQGGSVSGSANTSLDVGAQNNNTATGSNNSATTGGAIVVPNTTGAVSPTAATDISPNANDTPRNMNSQTFRTYASNRWDTDRDGVVSRAEWDTTVPSWYGSTAARPFNTWDANNNGTLESTELMRMFDTSDLYRRYDINGDGVIDDSEATKMPK